jgi:hypothetical protein
MNLKKLQRLHAHVLRQGVQGLTQCIEGAKEASTL